MKNDITEQLVHKTSNLLAAIYTFGEPALDSGEGMREALEEILKIGTEVETALRDAKIKLRQEEQ